MSITSVVNDTVTSVSLVNAQKPLPPTISGYSVGGLDDTALDPAGGQTVQINGTGFLAGATITFDGNAVSIVTYVSPNQLTFTSPAKSAGTYTIYVVNPDGGTAIYIPGIIYSVLPTWTTSAGSLGSYYETTSISNTVVASGDAPITYSLYSGSLPTGATLYANGVISGSAPVDSSSTTYSFTIQATDAQLQDSTRSFSLTINTDVVTWVSPANATTYTSAVDSAIANVTLSATDAAGYAVSYSANALPTGLSLAGANISGTPTVVADSSTLLTATAATTNRSATRTINWSITVANDAYFEYNTLLIPGASTTFVDDASTNNFAVSIFGDTKPNNFNPYTPGYYSNYFDGNGDYWTAAADTAFNFGTGDFTIECWVYPISNGLNYPTFLGSVTGWSAGASGHRFNNTGYANKFWFGLNGSGGLASGDPFMASTSTFGFNKWYHYAVTRSGNTWRMFVNGVLENTQTYSGSYDAGLGGLRSGWSTWDGVNGYFTGNTSNLRLVKGTALYTANFTPSTTPLTAIANTSLLTCQSNRFIDNSTNNFTLTVTGNTSINSFIPFTPNSSYSTYGSGYFDGTGDYLLTPSSSSFGMGTGNFTIEFWYYASSSQGSRTVLVGNNLGFTTNAWNIQLNNASPSITNKLQLWAYNLNSGAVVIQGSTTLAPNIWYHVALVRSGNTFTFYLNGVSDGTATSSASLDGGGTNTIAIARDGTDYYTGYMTDVRLVKGTAVYTTTFTPPTAPLTAIANTSLLTLQNNQSVNNSVFLDNSSNNFLVTRNGNTTQGTFSPYGGNWSNYFDGSGDYLSAPSNAATAQWWDADYTIEAWIYNTVNSQSVTNSLPLQVSYGLPLSDDTYWAFGTNSSGFLYFYYYNGTLITNAISSVTVPLNSWNHITMVYTNSNSTLKGYINGVQVFSVAKSGTPQAPTGNTINIASTQNTKYNGYISNLRVVKGTAVYTSAFTPPTTPLTAITNTSLLTCQSNRLIDNSINNFTITKTGDTSVQRFSPFNPSSVTPTSYSGYFDGTGDYLSLSYNSAFNLGTSSFTWEAWIYPTDISGIDGIYGTSGGSGANPKFVVHLNTGTPSIHYNNLTNGVDLYTTATSAVTVNTWTHLAFVRNSSTWTWYINGVAAGTGSNSTNITFTSQPTYIGYGGEGYFSPFNGYISNMRLVKGTAVYTTNFTPSTTPLTAISGTSILTCQSTTFIDNSTNNFTITAYGNSQPTIQNPFGYTSATTNGYTVSTIGGSGYFDGTGDYLSFANSPTFANLNGNNFTVECWAYATTVASNICLMACTSYPTTTGFAIFILSGNLTVYVNTGSTVVGSIAFPTNAWNHVAFVRNSTTCTLYLNGVFVASATANITNPAATQPLVVGGITSSTGWNSNLYLTGYLSDARVVNGTALYTSNFVPPSAPLTAVQNTSALNNMTSAGIYDAAMMNNMETVGDAKLSTAVSKFGGSSMAFDGTGDYLSSSDNLSLGFGSGAFTVEGWIYLNNTSGTKGIVFGRGNNSFGFRVGQGYNGNVNGLNIVKSGVADLDYCSFTFATNTWYHIAVVRSGTTIYFFVNGTQQTTQGSGAGSFNYVNPTSGFYVGCNNDTNEQFAGYIDDLRITKGYARYTSNFTPPATAFPIY